VRGSASGSSTDTVVVQVPSVHWSADGAAVGVVTGGGVVVGVDFTSGPGVQARASANIGSTYLDPAGYGPTRARDGRGSVILGMLAGCAENWYAFDRDAERLTVPAGQGRYASVEVVTQPEAYPERRLSNALRVAFYTGPSTTTPVAGASVTSSDSDDTSGFPAAVNVLDAWADCDPTAPCDRTFEFRVACDGPADCVGSFSADAFLSTRDLGSAPDDALVIDVFVE
jgi:hypothetical protein